MVNIHHLDRAPVCGQWSKIDSLTRGFVCGPSVVTTNSPATAVVKHEGLIRRDAIIADLRNLVDFVPYRKTHKISIFARDGGELLWVRPFANKQMALLAWARVVGINIDDLSVGRTYELPSTFTEGELEYQFATVETFNTTPGGSAWTVPDAVNEVDALLAAGAGSGATGFNGGYHGGGGAAGGLILLSAHATTPAASLTLTVGPGGTGPSASATDGADGTDTVFDTETAVGGGGGGHGNNAATSGSGRNGGSGGGAGGSNGGTAGTGGLGTVGQGNDGGDGSNNNSGNAGGGGGSSSAGTGPSAKGTTNRGAGTSSSITGSAVTYAQGGNIGTANGAAPVDGTANRGDGGGGVDGGGSATRAGHGGYGVAIFSYTAANLQLDASGTGIFVLP